MKKILLLFIIIITFTLSCARTPYSPESKRTFQSENELYIINGLAETISVLDLDSLEIYNDVLLAGSAPNDIVEYAGLLHIINSLGNNILVYDKNTFNKVEDVYLGKSLNPWSIILKAGTGIAYIPNFIDNSISVINMSSYNISKKINLEGSPQSGIYISNKLYVTIPNWTSDGFGNGYIAVINGATDEFEKNISTPKNPQNIIFITNLNEAHIISTGVNGGDNSDDGIISILNISTGNITKQINIGGSPAAYGIDNETKLVYLSGVGGVMIYNYETKKIVNGSDNYAIPSNNANGLFSDIFIYDKYIFIASFSTDKILVYDKDTLKLFDEISGSDGVQSFYYTK